MCGACAATRPYRFRCERDVGELRTVLWDLEPGDKLLVRWTGGSERLVKVVQACPTTVTVEYGGLQTKITVGDLYYGRVRLTEDLLLWWLLETDQLKANALLNRYVRGRGWQWQYSTTA